MSSQSRGFGGSFALDLAAEVRRVFATLPFDVQETVLDKLDLIAASPPDPKLKEGRAADDAVTEIAGIRHYVFFMYTRDEAAEKNHRWDHGPRYTHSLSRRLCRAAKCNEYDHSSCEPPCCA